MKRLLFLSLVVAMVLFAFTGCAELLEMLGIGPDQSVDLRVSISFTNDKQNVLIIVDNEGTRSILDVDYRVVFSEDTTISAGDRVVHTGFFGSIGAGLSQDTELLISDFDLSDILLGAYYIGVIVDADNKFQEATPRKRARTAETYQHAATDPVAVTGVSLDQSEVSLSPGGTAQLNATVAPGDAADKSVTWTSSDPSVATVTTGGLVTALAAGSATITVTTTDGGFQAFCAVVVPGEGTVVSVVFEGPTEEVIDISGDDDQTLYKSDWDSRLSVSVNGAYGGLQWYVNGERRWDWDGAYSVEIHSWELETGVHSLTVIVLDNSVPYSSKALRFRVSY